MRVFLIVAAVVVGSLMAWLPHSLDDCMGYGVPSANYDVRVSVWPFGLECHDLEREVPVVKHRPGALETLAWIGLVGLLFSGARRSAFIRGTASAACYLALVAVLWLPSEPAGLFAALMLGPPIVFLADRLSRPPADRTPIASVVPAAVLPFVVLAGWLPGNFGGLEPLGILGGLVAGGAATAGLAWLTRGREPQRVAARRPDLPPPHTRGT